ncbi:MAG: IS5 family transposase [Roseivirga sp.]
MKSIEAYKRHDISDKVWYKLEPLLPGRTGMRGGVAKDNRGFINAVFWMLRTGSPWRDLPPNYGDWKNTHRRFSRWRDKGTWEAVLEALRGDHNFEWLIIDASHIKVHPHGAGAQGGNESMGRTKGGLNTKLHLAVDETGMPLRAIITSGTEADCKYASPLLTGMTAQQLLAERGYDTKQVVRQAKNQKMNVVIPSKRNRIVSRAYDKEAYKKRHLVETAFLYFKRWRGIATRYAKRASSFLAAIQIRCIALWANLS